jgi:hypothetical protein
MSKAQDRRIPFTKADENRIASASTWASLAAIILLLASVVELGVAGYNFVRMGIGPHGLANIPGKLLALVFSVLLAIFLMGSSSAFRKVARTDVADKAYLLQGFSKLHKFFIFTGISLIIMIVGTIVMFVLSLLGVALG